jgi:hypothetical protein
MSVKQQDERYCLSMQRYKGQQYSQLYFFRLHTIRQNLLSRVQERWPSLPVCKILGLEEGQLCVVVGTLYKQMQLKPSILEEYSKEVGSFVNSFLGFFCCQNAFVLRFFFVVSMHSWSGFSHQNAFLMFCLSVEYFKT